MVGAPTAKKTARTTKALEGVVGAAYGESSKAFAAFGFSARKQATKSAETKAAAVEKLRATRALRHTLGSRQKASLHGEVGGHDAPPPPPSHVTSATGGTNGSAVAPLFSLNGAGHA